MDKGKRKKVIKIYRPHWLGRTFLLIMLPILLCLSFYWLYFSVNMLGKNNLAFVIGLNLIWFFAWLTTQVFRGVVFRFIVTTDGLELHDTGLRSIEWDNLYKLGWDRPQFTRGGLTWGIILYSSALGKYEGIARILSLIDPMRFRKNIYFVPLIGMVDVPRRMGFFRSNVDIDAFRETEFGQILYAYAPHLFDDYSDRKPKNRLEDGYDEQEDYWYEDDMMQDEQNG